MTLHTCKRYTAMSLALGALLFAGTASSADDAKGHGCCSHGGDHHSMMDTNSDGKITESEHAAGAKKMFTMMDTDKNGSVTAAEMDAVHENMKDGHDEHGDMHHGDMKHGDAKTGDKMAGKMKSSADKISMMDANGDGAMSAQEHEAGAAKMFKQMDTDKDGSVSAAEMKTGHERMMPKDPK